MKFIDEFGMRKILYSVICIFLVALIVLGVFFIVYDNNVAENSDELLSKGANESEIISPTSSTSDKNIVTAKSMNNVVKNDNTVIESENETNTISNNSISKDVKKNEIKIENSNEVQNEKASYELSFMAPVSGEIINDFSMDSLIYSETLDEWTTHSGIDIKAKKTSVVKASEKGKVESIKNDPRYGITITIVHENDFKTVYSNLLSTEFVKEGQEVEKGDTIATVGNTSSFEILEDSHLHFEIYKSGKVVNPTEYLKE